MQLDGTVYCIAYRDERYEQGEYALEYFTDPYTFRKAADERAKRPGAEIIEFSFRPVDLIKERSNAASTQKEEEGPEIAELVEEIESLAEELEWLKWLNKVWETSDASL